MQNDEQIFQRIDVRRENSVENEREDFEKCKRN